jgi:nickel-type superoxide dismutase maturation protease
MREAGWADRVLVMMGLRRAFRVRGDSMRPTLGDGDVVLVKNASSGTIGDIVLAAHPFKTSVTMLKRVVSIDGDGRVDLRGDNPEESSDSRSFGKIAARDVIGKVACRLTR